MIHLENPSNPSRAIFSDGIEYLNPTCFTLPEGGFKVFLGGFCRFRRHSQNRVEIFIIDNYYFYYDKPRTCGRMKKFFYY